MPIRLFRSPARGRRADRVRYCRRADYLRLLVFMDNSVDRPAKRTRTSVDDSTGVDRDAAQVATRMIEDHSVWMDDGNVVISAGDNPTRLFKCHRSVLCKHSIVFREILALPPAHESAEDQYQGLPRVHLTDKPEDVRALLNLLYNPRWVSKTRLKCSCSHE